MRKVWLLASAVLAFLNFVKSQEVARTLYSTSTRGTSTKRPPLFFYDKMDSLFVILLITIHKPARLAGILPEALRTKCARCSPIQKENALKIITRLYYDYPDQYRALRERWDPSGEYHRRFEEYLRGLQFNQIGGGGSGSSNGGTGVGNTIESGGNDRPAAQLPPSPIVGLWNQLGTKIADTADAIAGMLQKTVDVLVTSHIQSHQRALRRS
uniref:Chemosensory protein 5 n=1 Tax=Anopheles stephensi TaxID=30069 RepID=A0A182Y033_ANOST